MFFVKKENKDENYKNDFIKNLDLTFGVNYEKLDITTYNNTKTYRYIVNSIVGFFAGIIFKRTI